MPASPLIRVAVPAQAWVTFCRSMGHAFEQLAQDVEAASATTPDTDEPLEPVRSRWHAAVLRLTGIGTDVGLAAPEISRQINYDPANMYAVLEALERNGWVERVPGTSNPYRWRLVKKHRTNRVLQASRVIPVGCWTTYGDISIAVYDHVRGALGVGTLAAANAAFANPHRVLTNKGTISSSWRDSEGRGPDYCGHLLLSEGVRFDGDIADAVQRFGWQAIKEALDAEEDAGDS